MELTLYALLKEFNINDEIESYTILTSGHINTTCLVHATDDNGKENKYILQRINSSVFKNPHAVMANIANVTSYIASKLKKEGEDTSRKVLSFFKAKSGEHYTTDENGDYWRIYSFIDNSVTFNTTNDPVVLYETGKAFGEFQHHLSSYPSETLFDIIPNFHNTVSRYNDLKKMIALNPANRLKNVIPEVKDYLKLETIATKMAKMQLSGELPVRVTHNDTKCNNVLFDEDTKEHLAVIDLDTVMPGLVGFDFGDAMRFAGNATKEDEADLTKVKIDLNKFKAFTKGFLSEVAPNLTENEKNTLALGAISMTAECGTRFLTDYLDGDNYFKTHYPDQNLNRARCQLQLVKDMIKNYDKMKQIVDEAYAEIMAEQNEK